MPDSSFIKVAFASGTDELNVQLVERMRQIFPELPLYLVSEFPPEDRDLRWVPYRQQSLYENWGRCRAAFRGKSIRMAGVLLVPDVPFRRMRLLAFALAPLYFLAINENLNEFMLRPRSIPTILRHLLWRTRNTIKWRLRPNGVWRHHDWKAGLQRLASRSPKPAPPIPATPLKPGLSLICPANVSFDFVAPPDSEVLAIEHVNEALSRAQYSRVCIVDEAFHPDLPSNLLRAFDEIPDLFCVSAPHAPALTAGLTYTVNVTGCAIYDTAKLRALGGVDGSVTLRAWQHDWPTVSPVGACDQRVEGPLPDVRGSVGSTNYGAATVTERSYHGLLAPPIADGSVTTYPGRAPSATPRVLIASAYVPFPLAHGGAVRMDNLTRRAAAGFDQILIAFSETGAPPAPELTERYIEVVLVRRAGSHSVRNTGRPDVVEQFASDAFRAALRRSIARWRPSIAQLEFTQMAQYAADCAPARTILVEHDITFDLYQQLARHDDDWDLHRQVKKWRRFETDAWKQVSCVVTMSERDRGMVTGTQAATLPNGVDLDRFRPSDHSPEPRRLLFVGSFSHLPNLLAVEFFLKQVWPRLRDARLHIIAGARHEYYVDYQAQRVSVPLDQPGIEVEGFVSDVRPAYARASVVVAPLIASAGTNLKILEAMACARPVVSTPEGVHGIDMEPGAGVIVVRGAEEMASAIERLLADAAECKRIGEAGRMWVEERYGWDGIAEKQADLYRKLMK